MKTGVQIQRLPNRPSYRIPPTLFPSYLRSFCRHCDLFITLGDIVNELHHLVRPFRRYRTVACRDDNPAKPIRPTFGDSSGKAGRATIFFVAIKEMNQITTIAVTYASIWELAINRNKPRDQLSKQWSTTGTLIPDSSFELGDGDPSFFLGCF